MSVEQAKFGESNYFIELCEVLNILWRLFKCPVHTLYVTTSILLGVTFLNNLILFPLAYCELQKQTLIKNFFDLLVILSISSFCHMEKPGYLSLFSSINLRYV
jgi:hypothetical protein